jgi:hypothetical protein
MNPASGVVELLLDNIAFVRDLDEPTASAALVSAFHYFGWHPG